MFCIAIIALLHVATTAVKTQYQSNAHSQVADIYGAENVKAVSLA